MPAYRDSDGKHWYCKFYYKDYSGKRRQKLKRGFLTKKDALAYEESFINGNLSGGEEVFFHVYEIYIEEMSHRCKLSTMNNKTRIFETKILPYFGRMRLKDITPESIRKWQDDLCAPSVGLSKTYLRTINTQFVAFMNYATKLYGLHENPCKRVTCMGMSNNHEMRFWTPEEYKTFRAVVKDDPLAYICFEVLYWTGMRTGEMLALTPDDINFTNNEISITKTYQRVRGHEYVWEPKTNASVRRILMPGFLSDELNEYILTIRTYDSFHRIFPVDDSWLCYRIHKYAKMAGVHDIKVHSLRHSAASLLINEGFTALEVSRRLGHRKVSTTLDTYSHMFPTRQDAIATRLNEIGG